MSEEPKDEKPAAVEEPAAAEPDAAEPDAADEPAGDDNDPQPDEDAKPAAAEEEKEEEGDVEDPAPEESPAKEAGDEEAPAEEKKAPAAAAAGGAAAAGSAAKPKPKSKKQINPNFKDLRETGQWGEISRKEKIGVAVALAVIAIAVVIVVIVFVVVLDDDEVNTVEGATMAPTSSFAPSAAPTTSAPTMAPTDVAVEIELERLLFSIGNNSVTADTIDTFSTDPASYEGIYLDETQPANLRALSWQLEASSMSNPLFTASLYGLATMYYALGGPNWTNTTGWMEQDGHVCDWHGVRCDRLRRSIEELELSGNNLVGAIPPEISFLGNIRAIWLRDNQLSGPIQADPFAELPLLAFLYLQNNLLTGSVPGRLRNAVSLSTLFVQGNDLTGVWPNRLCPGFSSDTASLEYFGYDCDEIQCPQCCTADNCY